MNSTIEKKLAHLAALPKAFRQLDVMNQITPSADRKEREAVRKNLPAELQPLYDKACAAADKQRRAKA